MSNPLAAFGTSHVSWACSCSNVICMYAKHIELAVLADDPCRVPPGDERHPREGRLRVHRIPVRPSPINAPSRFLSQNAAHAVYCGVQHTPPCAQYHSFAHTQEYLTHIHLHASACMRCTCRYDWKESEARKNLLRTHTTAVSSRMLYKLAQVHLVAIINTSHANDDDGGNDDRGDRSIRKTASLCRRSSSRSTVSSATKLLMRHISRSSTRLKAAAHAHTYTCTCARIKCMHTCTHAHMHPCTHTNACIHACTSKYICRPSIS